MDIKIIYEDEDVLVVDKPAGIVTIDLVNSYPGARKVHRLDKDTSGVLLTAKNDKVLIFLQKQFSSFARHLASYGESTEAPGEGKKDRKVEKRYLALVVGNLKNEKGKIEGLIGRAPKDRKKQKVYLAPEPGAKGKRKAITEYKVIKRFTQLNAVSQQFRRRRNYLTGVKNYTLVEVFPKTGRKHQIRCHLAYLGHPIVGDKMYGFKNQPCPKGLKRQFLHASYLKIKLPNGKIKEFKSALPEDLKICLQKLKH